MRLKSQLFALWPAFILVGCGGDGEGASEGVAFEASEEHQFPAIPIEAGAELGVDEALCQSWTLDNDEPLYVQKIRQTNNGAWHHSNWLFVPEDIYPGPDDGYWPCEERGYQQVEAAIRGGTLFAQSTQALEEVHAFPDGAVVEIPPRSKIVGDLHLVNVSAAPLDSAIRIALQTIPSEEVQVRLRPLVLDNTALVVPARSESRFGMTCDLGGAFEQFTGAPPDYGIYYVLSHYHQRGNYFRLSFIENDGSERQFMEIRNGVGEPLGLTFDPPVQAEGATALRMECGYRNDEDEEVTYGPRGRNEMCVMLAYVDADLKIAVSSEFEAESQVIGSDDAGRTLHEVSCGEALAVPAR